MGEAVIPQRPPADLLPVEECVEILRDAVLPHLKNRAHLATFHVRPGVTLVSDRDGDPVVEVFLLDRVKGVACRRISQVVQSNTLEIYVKGLLEDLQERQSFTAPISYRRVEVLREILYEMSDLLPEGCPEVLEFQENTAPYYRKKIDLIRGAIKRRLEG